MECCRWFNSTDDVVKKEIDNKTISELKDAVINLRRYARSESNRANKIYQYKKEIQKELEQVEAERDTLADTIETMTTMLYAAGKE